MWPEWVSWNCDGYRAHFDEQLPSVIFPPIWTFLHTFTFHLWIICNTNNTSKCTFFMGNLVEESNKEWHWTNSNLSNDISNIDPSANSRISSTITFSLLLWLLKVHKQEVWAPRPVLCKITAQTPPIPVKFWAKIEKQTNL